LNHVRGLLRLWVVLSVIWTGAIGLIVYSYWPPEPEPQDSAAGVVDDLLPSIEDQRRDLLLDGAGMVLVGSGSMLLLGAALAWVTRRFRKAP
jgi:hypothetical protein